MRFERYAPVVLRVALALVFLYFGFVQAVDPDAWAGLVPSGLTGFGLSAQNLVMLNSFVELTLGVFLLLGLYTRFSALVLGLHLLGISFSFGLTPTGVRDFGLAFATFAVFLMGPDEFSLDKKLIGRKASFPVTVD